MSPDLVDVAAAELAGILERLEVSHPHLDGPARARKAARVAAMLRASRDPSRWTS